MRRYFRHILLSLISVICTVSCIEELDDPNPVRVSDTPTVLVPRVKSFTNQYITKAGYTTDETQISSLTVLVFNNYGQLVHIQQPSNLSSIELNKSMLDAPGQDVTAATIVMIANVGLDKITDGNGNTFKKIKEDKLSLTLSGMEKCTFDFSTNPVITSIPDDFDGFPMIGGVKNVNLSATKESQNAISVPLKILYAKINFSIYVDNGTENTGTGMQFTLNGYSVHNVAKKTGMAIPTEKGMPVLDFLGNIIDENVNAENDGATVSSAYPGSTKTGDKTGTTNVSGQPITFTFYVAENRYNHSGLSGIYPDGWLTEKPEEDVKGYNPESEEDLKKINGVKYFYDDLIQQYKPKLAGSSSNATYVLLEGLYTDYRGTVWDVDYKVYLGKDNSQNFHVDRNSEYHNSITIKGIRNNDGYTETDSEGNLVDEHVWIDHRVNVTLDGTSPNKAADCVTITRETLIDSHIEVRPLRVKWDENRYLGAAIFLPRYTSYNGSQIDEPEEGETKNWIGIENNDGTRYQDITKYSNNGKRKYFTTDLIKDLYINNLDIETSGNEKIIPINNNDCIWIYIDEYTDINATSYREAKIELRFYKENGSYDSEIYTIRQQPLVPVSEGVYIESYEEYLHSYDSEDKYNLNTSPTDYTQQGIVWGLYDDNITNQSILSKKYFTINGFSSTWLEGTIISGDSRYKFEFALSEDEAGFSVVDADKNAANVEDTGLEFTRRIAVDAQKNVTIADMSQIPESAVQYCLSKNKFYVDPNEQDHHIDIHWYLPAIDEMNVILEKGGEDEFPGNHYYWSSQPAYEKVTYSSSNYLLIENPGYARATDGSTDAKPTNTTYRSISTSLSNWGVLEGQEPDFDKMSGYHSRTTKNRIRCAYSKDGKTGAKITAPDGIGPKTIYMRAIRKDNGGDGYFKQYVPATATPDPDKETFFGTTTYAYPIVGDLSDGSFSYDPSKYSAPGKGWITTVRSEISAPVPGADKFTLGKYPGLSPKVVEGPTLQIGTLNYNMTEGSEWKADTKTIESADKKIVDYSNLGDVMLNKLDGTEGIFSIQFANGRNTTNNPKYLYDETVSSAKETWTRHWMVPKYEKTETTFNETVPPTPFTAENIVGRAGLYELGGTWRVATTNIATQSYKDLNLARSAALEAAVSAAKTQLASDIETYRTQNQYDELPDIKYNETEAREDPDYTERTEETGILWNKTTYYGVTCTINMSATVTFTKTGLKESWVYQPSTGRWYNESDEEWPDSSDGKEDKTWPNYYKKDSGSTGINKDELTFYNGNTFTVSVADGYVIGGIKVYFSESNVLSDNPVGADKYLRLVPTGYSSSNSHPDGMTYVDGDEGYAEMGIQGAREVSLQLVECEIYEPSWFEQLLGAQPSIKYNQTVSSEAQSIIIEKLEITYKKK